MLQKENAAVLSLPESVADWIVSRSWLRIVRAKNVSISWDRWSVPLELVRAESAVDDEQLLERLSRAIGPGQPIPLVTSSYLRSSLREKLESRGFGYLDRRGNFHLPWQHGLIHIEAGAASPYRVRAEVGGQAGLGVHGIRAVQAMLTEAGDLQVSRLAEVAALSLSRTHSVLRLLEAEGLVRVTGEGPRTRRHVVDRSRLLDWLAAQPAARRSERKLDVVLYARTPRDVWRLCRERLDRAQIAHGLTGSAAAAVFEAGPTTVLLSSIRVSPRVGLEDAVEALKAERTERGANVRLIRDTGMLGSMHTIERDGILVSPLARVYLDTLSERRGEDIARQFREVILGY